MDALAKATTKYDLNLHSMASSLISRSLRPGGFLVCYIIFFSPTALNLWSQNSTTDSLDVKLSLLTLNSRASLSSRPHPNHGQPMKIFSISLTRLEFSKIPTLLLPPICGSWLLLLRMRHKNLSELPSNSRVAFPSKLLFPLRQKNTLTPSRFSSLWMPSAGNTESDGSTLLRTDSSAWNREDVTNLRVLLSCAWPMSILKALPWTETSVLWGINSQQSSWAEFYTMVISSHQSASLSLARSLQARGPSTGWLNWNYIKEMLLLRLARAQRWAPESTN